MSVLCTMDKLKKRRRLAVHRGKKEWPCQLTKKIFGPDVDKLCKENSEYNAIHEQLANIPVDIQVAYDPATNGPVVQIKSMLEHPVRLAAKYNFHPDFGQKFFISLGVVEKFCVRPNFMPPPTSSYLPMGGLTEFCDENQHDSEVNCEDYDMNEDECMGSGRCIWNNVSSDVAHCIPLPGDESNRPRVEVEKQTCDWDQARCENTIARGNRAECVPKSDDDMCSDCKDRKAFYNYETNEFRCETPSPKTCRESQQFFCKETGSCVYDCFECGLRSNATDIPGIEVVDRVPLIGNEKSNKCVLPSPKSCHARGEVFCEISQECVPACDSEYCRRSSDNKVRHTYLTNARKGVRFQSKANATYREAIEVCKLATREVCKNLNKFFCKDAGEVKCVDDCRASCGKRVAEHDETCKRPKNLPVDNYYCNSTNTVGANCDNCDPYTTANMYSKTCEKAAAPDTGKYRCNITTGRDSKIEDVEDCYADCNMYDYETNKYFALQKADDSTKSCVALEICPRPTVKCNNEQIFDPADPSKGLPMCITNCESCYKPIIASGEALTEYEHRNVNKSYVCKSEKDEKNDCYDKKMFWCSPTKACLNDCSSCEENHAKKPTHFSESTYMYDLEDTEKSFNIENYDTYQCENSCKSVVKEIEETYEWQGEITSYKYEMEFPRPYCPILKSCLEPNYEWDNMCKDCGVYTLASWKYDGTVTCEKPTKESCKENWMRYCPSTKQCVFVGGGCSSCPKYEFEPPHWPYYDDADASSCLQSADDAVNMCSSSGEKYCSTDGYSRCETSCDMCVKYTPGTNADGTPNFYEFTETHSIEENNRCSFRGTYQAMHVDTHTHNEENSFEWTDSYYCESSPDEYVVNCSECGQWMDADGMVHYSNMVADETGTCTKAKKKYGCTDVKAFNFDPEATDLEEGESCDGANSVDCWSCDYTSYDNSHGMKEAALSHDDGTPYKDEDGMYMDFDYLVPNATLFD